MTHTQALLTRAALLAERIAQGDKRIAASKRAARIVDRVLPLGRGRSALYDPAGFIANAGLIADRQALYATIYARLRAKVLRECPADVRRAA